MRREPREPSSEQQPFPWTLAGGVLLLATALNVGPPGPLALVRGAVRDALRPGLMGLAAVADRVENWCAGASPPAPDDPTSATATRIRELELETARLRRELAATRARGARPRGEATTPLVAPGLVAARWLGGESVAHLRSSGILSAGSRDGVAESALVLAAPGPRVDLGQRDGLAPGDPVFAGRVVLGKIAEVGQVTSTLRLVTDPEFSARVRITRRTPQGLEVIAEGTLVGEPRPPGGARQAAGEPRLRRGTPTAEVAANAASRVGTEPGAENEPGMGGARRRGRCRLKNVTEPVAVGDQVYTAESDGVLRFPMYYGEICAAELPPAASEWEVEVTPAATACEPDEVEILRLSLLRENLLAN
ncbi:MAG: rod shape-determining protein MreC [Planctomycetaceae bacterium]